MIALALHSLHIPWWVIFLFYYLGYVFLAASVYLNGYAQEYFGWRHPGRPGKMHKVIYRWHTGLNPLPDKSHGDEAGRKRIAGGTSRATAEGVMITFSSLKRWHRALRNNLIIWAVLTFMACMTIWPVDTIRSLTLFMVWGLLGIVAFFLIRVRRRHGARLAKFAQNAAPFRQGSIRNAAADAAAGAATIPLAVPGILADPETKEEPKLEGIPRNVMANLLAGRMSCSAAEILARLTLSQDGGKLVLPDTFGALIRQRDEIEEVIEAHTKGKVRFEWLTTVAPRTLRWFPVVEHKLPAMVRFRDYLPQLQALGPREFGVGLEANRTMYVSSHNGDKPWHCRFAGSGTGKSSGFLVKAAQICHNDRRAELYCIDTKQVSFEALHGIPGVHIFDNPQSEMAAIWQVFYTLHGIMRDRYGAMREKRARPEDFNDIWVLIDEGNDLSSSLKSYHKNQLEGTTATPMIWNEAIAPLFRLGRQARIFGEFMAQDLDGRMFGGETLKTSFGVFGAAGFLPAQFARTVGPPAEESLDGPGRILMCVGKKRKWVQGFYDEEEWLRDYALANRR